MISFVLVGKLIFHLGIVCRKFKLEWVQLESYDTRLTQKKMEYGDSQELGPSSAMIR